MGRTDGIAGWWRRLFGRTAELGLDPTRPDLVVVASSFDDAEACSTALERGASTAPSWTADAEAVLRHHLTLPANRVDDAIGIAAQDGYMATEAAAGSESTDTASLVLQRVQVLDTLHCSQESSRMAGLAQRLDGTARGWDALQPASGDNRASAG